MDFERRSNIGDTQIEKKKWYGKLLKLVMFVTWFDIKHIATKRQNP